MAVLTPEDRDGLWREFAELPIADRGRLTGLNKWQFRDVFDSLDTFLEDHLVAINNAFPAPAKTALNVKQKAWCFEFVVRKWREKQ